MKYTEQELATELTSLPPTIVPLLHGIVGYAAQGHRANGGDLTSIDPEKGDGLFGRHDFRGVLYVPCRVDGLPPTALQGIPLTTAEVRAVHQVGCVRIMAALGERNRFFPTTIWIDPNRDPLFTSPSYVNESVITRMNLRLQVPGSKPSAYCYLQVADGQTKWEEINAKVEAKEPLVDYVIRDPGTKRGLLNYNQNLVDWFTLHREKLLEGENPQCGFFTFPNATAVQILAYKPGEPSINAITAPGSTGEGGLNLLGNFVYFIQSESADQSGAVFIEDGFLVFVPSLAKLVTAICEKDVFDINVKGQTAHMPFAVRFKDTTDDGDPKQKPRSMPTQPVELSHVQLLTPEEQIMRALGTSGTELFAAYINQLATTATKTFVDEYLENGVMSLEGSSLKMLMIFRANEKPKVQLAWSPNPERNEDAVPNGSLEEFASAVVNIADTPTVKEEFKFSVAFYLNPQLAKKAD